MLQTPSTLCAISNNNFLVTQGGEFYQVPFPCKPYEWIESATEGEEVYIIGKGLSRIRKQEYGVIPTEKGITGRGGRTVIDFTTQIIYDNHDFITSLSNKKDPYPVFLDIETASTDEYFPNSERDPIIAMQIKYIDSKPIILETTSQYSEKEMILEALSILQQNPETNLYSDFIVGYYTNKFDLPYLVDRMKHHKILSEIALKDRLLKLGYEKETVRIYYPASLEPSKRQGEKTAALFSGLFSMDLAIQTKRDTTIAHLPKKGLKQVSKYYGFEPYDIPVEAKRDMEKFREQYKDKFIKYIESDILATEYLYNNYLPAMIASSNLLIVPLIQAQRFTSGQKSTTAVYREAKKNKFVGIYTNSERYATIYQQSPKYQGAIVGCIKRGYVDHTIYVDCLSMYPNIMHDFNISPDRYKYLGMEPYTDSIKTNWITQELSLKDFIVEKQQDGTVIIKVPDDYYESYFVMQCDFENDGYIRKLIADLNARRSLFKKKAKKALKEYNKSNRTNKQYHYDYLRYNSEQTEAKIVNNTIYGIQGDQYSKVGDLPAAIMVTAIGRWIMSQMISIFNEGVLEIDTDGLLLDKDKVHYDIDEVNKMLRKKMVETFFIPEHKMRFELEFEGEGSVYLYKSKNYILRKNDDALLTIKGSSFKGYDKAKVISDAVTIMSNAIMYKTKSYEEAVKEATSIRNRPLEDFKFTKSIHKLPSEYKDYDDIFIIFSGFSRENLTKKEVIKTIKDRLIMWIKDHIKSGKRSSELCSLVRGAKTEEELLSIANSLTIKQSNKDKTKLPFMLQICLTMMERGRKIETDMYVDYFWTLTPHGYTLYEDMNDSIYIDYDRYSKEIGRIIERFSFADPAFTSSFLFNDEEIEGFYIDKSSDEENNNDEVEE